MQQYQFKQLLTVKPEEVAMEEVHEAFMNMAYLTVSLNRLVRLI
jgi:hypothetical protein